MTPNNVVRLMTAITKIIKARYTNLSVDEATELAGKIVDAVIEELE